MKALMLLCSLAIALLWSSATAALENRTDCGHSDKNYCVKEILWVWFVTIDTPFRKAEQLLSQVSLERRKMNLRKGDTDKALALVEGELQCVKNITVVKSLLMEQKKALENATNVYEKIETNIKRELEARKTTTEEDYHFISGLNSVAGTVWELGRSYRGEFNDLRITFNAIRNKDKNSTYEKRANEVVDKALNEPGNSAGLSDKLVMLLGNVSARYKDRHMGVFGDFLLNNLTQWQELIRNFTSKMETVQKEAQMTELDGKSKEDLGKIVDVLDEEMSKHVSRLLGDVRDGLCGEFKTWSEIRKKVREGEQAKRVEMQHVIKELKVMEENIAAARFQQVELELIDANKEADQTWMSVKETSESSQVQKMEADNIALFELERSNQIRYLMENASVREKKAMNILGASAKCEGLFVEKELMRSIANETNNVGKQDWSAVCRSHFPLCSEKNTSRFLSAFVAAGGASVQNSSISSAIRLENTTYERRMNSRTKLLSSARKALELYKRRILNFISYVWNGTCAVKANVERDYLKLKGLKRQLRQAKEEINMLHSGASMQKVVEGKGTTLVKFEKGGSEGFLVHQGKSVLKSPALPEQAVNGNVSMRVSALLEQAEDFDGSDARGAGCAVWTGSGTDVTAEQLVANLTGEIDVHDVLLEVHVNILRRVARGERLLASLRDAKKKLEAEIEEARKGEQCEPLWRQLLRLVRG